MNILYSHDIFSSQNYGGISRYFHEITKAISKTNENPIIFAPVYVNRYLKGSDGVGVQGIRVPYFRKGVRVTGLINGIASRLFIKQQQNIDIFHETYYTRKDYSPPGAKRVITCFDMVHERLSNMISQRDKTSNVKIDALRRADHVICISQNTQRDLIELLKVPEKKTSVTYLGCSLVAQEPATMRQEGSPFLLYVGARFAYKNFGGLLRSFAASSLLKSGVPLVCFGGGEFNREEIELANSLKIPEGQLVNVAGGDQRLIHLYKTATAFVYPSLYEGFGIPPLEAMSCGCPVVCSNSSSLPEVVGDAAELFDPTDYEMMRDSIERLFTDTERARELVRRGYERVKQFSWDKCGQETLSIYKSLL